MLNFFVSYARERSCFVAFADPGSIPGASTDLNSCVRTNPRVRSRCLNQQENVRARVVRASYEESFHAAGTQGPVFRSFTDSICLLRKRN